MKEWHDLLRRVMLEGETRADRTGVGTRSLFGVTLELPAVKDHFPAVTTKRLAFKQMAAELSCFVQGLDNLKDFHEMGCTIWDANGNASYWQPEYPGHLGRIYGVQWRDWLSTNRDNDLASTDQLANLIRDIKKDPTSRRLMVTAWNPGELDQMCLPPCHTHFQVSVRHGKRLCMTVYMRSVDMFLGLPFDIASYGLLLSLLAKDTGYEAGKLTFFLGDAHIYLNHLEQVFLVLGRTPLPPPKLILAENVTTLRFQSKDAMLDQYLHYGEVKAEMNV